MNSKSTNNTTESMTMTVLPFKIVATSLDEFVEQVKQLQAEYKVSDLMAINAAVVLTVSDTD